MGANAVRVGEGPGWRCGCRWQPPLPVAGTAGGGASLRLEHSVFHHSFGNADVGQACYWQASQASGFSSEQATAWAGV